MKGVRHKLTGQRFGKLVVVAQAGHGQNGKFRATQWLCRCDCGRETLALGTRLARGRTKSCGCYIGEKAREIRKRVGTPIKHGMCHSPTYRSWYAMIQRCTNPNNSHFKYYGGAGVVVCDGWRDFRNFLADMGERPEDMTLDRIDPLGNYEQLNCRWATAQIQARNKRANRKQQLEGATQ